MTTAPTPARIERGADRRLRFIPADGREPVEKVRLALAWPLRFADRYLVVLDAEGRENVSFASIDDLDPACHDLVREELATRYFVTRVTAVRDLRLEHVVSFWDVDTDRGPRDFAIEESEHNPERISPTRWLLVDVRGNRYLIDDVSALDRRSRANLYRLMI